MFTRPPDSCLRMPKRTSGGRLYLRDARMIASSNWPYGSGRFVWLDCADWVRRAATELTDMEGGLGGELSTDSRAAAEHGCAQRPSFRRPTARTLWSSAIPAAWT